MSLGSYRIAALAVFLTYSLALPALRLKAEETATENSPPAGEKAEKAKAPQAGLTGVEVFERMLPSTCWVRLEHTNGEQFWSSWGTGWVYDLGRNLIVTNEHVVHGSDDVTGFFPQS